MPSSQRGSAFSRRHPQPQPRSDQVLTKQCPDSRRFALLLRRFARYALIDNLNLNSISPTSHSRSSSSNHPQPYQRRLSKQLAPRQEPALRPRAEEPLLFLLNPPPGRASLATAASHAVEAIRTAFFVRKVAPHCCNARSTPTRPGLQCPILLICPELGWLGSPHAGLVSCLIHAGAAVETRGTGQCRDKATPCRGCFSIFRSQALGIPTASSRAVDRQAPRELPFWEDATRPWLPRRFPSCET